MNIQPSFLTTGVGCAKDGIRTPDGLYESIWDSVSSSRLQLSTQRRCISRFPPRKVSSMTQKISHDTFFLGRCHTFLGVLDEQSHLTVYTIRVWTVSRRLPRKCGSCALERGTRILSELVCAVPRSTASRTLSVRVSRILQSLLRTSSVLVEECKKLDFNTRCTTTGIISHISFVQGVSDPEVGSRLLPQSRDQIRCCLQRLRQPA